MSDTEAKDLLAALDSVQEVKIGDVVKGEVLAFDDSKQAIVGIENAGVIQIKIYTTVLIFECF